MARWKGREGGWRAGDRPLQRVRGWRRLWGGAAAGGHHGEAEGEGGRMETEMTYGTHNKGTLVFLSFSLFYPVGKYNFN